MPLPGPGQRTRVRVPRTGGELRDAPRLSLARGTGFWYAARVPGDLLEQLRALDVTRFEAVSLARNSLEREVTSKLQEVLRCDAGLDLAIYWPDGRIVCQFDWGDADYVQEVVHRLRSLLSALLPRCTPEFFQFEPWPHTAR